MDIPVFEEIRKHLEHLSTEGQHNVLEFARSLAQQGPVGVPGTDLIRFAGTIEPDDIALMAHAIEEGCESVDCPKW